MFTHCHSFSDRLKRWAFAFYLVANVNFCVRMISAYLANAWATRSKIKIEPSLIPDVIGPCKLATLDELIVIAVAGKPQRSRLIYKSRL